MGSHGDGEGLARARTHCVAEGGELELEPSIVPRHEDPRGSADELVVSYKGESDPEAAPVLHSHRKLDHARTTGADRAPLDPPPVAEDLEHHLLRFQPGEDQETGGLPDRHR